MHYTLSIYWSFILLICNSYTLIHSQYAGTRDRVRGNPTRAPLRGDQPPSSDMDFFEIPEEIHPLTDLTTHWHHRGYVPVKLHPCEQSSCYPATGNLLFGREKQLHASSTCGLHEQQRYCIVSHLEDPKKCFWCDSRPSNILKPMTNHSISNIVYRYHPGTRNKSWWQSENGKENVSIQLDLEAEFHFTHLIITFKTFRPAAMLIERSYDFGRTWQIYRYFASSCSESFPNVPINPENLKNLTDVVCETKYSSVAPSTDGELVYKVLPPHMHIDNPYSKEVQNLLKMTNLRINFTKLHTLGDDLLDKREEIQEKYYYAISDMTVRGSCSCYGHANRCLPLPGMETKPDMVHGRCECTHNTKGSNCEECEDFFRDLPWRPAIGKQTNACKKCNCNNHATSCRFDAAWYEKTGRISGGLCEDCKHNTMGSNCELCKPFYYRDPLRDIQDPEVCRPCDCDPDGSLEGGVCDSITDPFHSLEAGKCHCKTNVEGRRCDLCKNGFWNFNASLPHGCQSCSCDHLGTIDSQGCNVYTGECTCKRYVTGRDCNQCLPEYWGLSDKKDGCQPCFCDPGGSYDNNCDVVAGQCKCREHMTGRRCNIPQQQHFTASIDFLLYEAELARPSSTCQVVIREPYRDGRVNTWTGTGFVKAIEGGSVEFSIDDIRTSMDYDIVIRYESLLPKDWNDVTVTIMRPKPIDPSAPCASIHPSDDIKKVILPANARSVSVFPPVCLEAGEVYKVRLNFNSYVYNTPTPAASVLIDSIALIPRIEAIPLFNYTAPGEYVQRQCSFTDFINNNEHISELCQKYYNSIGAYVFNGAISCQCDPTGSTSKLCQEYGGNCNCKTNVVGRRCDRCAPGTYGFGPEGCKACDCNSIGALDNFCNVTTGQCKCRSNTYGRGCDQCRTGFWNFPNCQRCDCHGHADICDSRTGACVSCRDYTIGHTCDRCVDGYYGDPRLGVDIPCRPCPCPGIVGSGHSFANRCYLDVVTKDVICECQEGYSGSRCNICADNYYGNPEVPRGSCKPCDCNNKIDLLKPGNCDTRTGKCMQCLYYTTGDHCEVCKPGYYRYTDDQLCRECVCHILGTNHSLGPCNPYDGQCPCFPNVQGTNCDHCAVNHWKIASGSGCESCNCDPVGSKNQQCNLFDGQCECKENFGGRQCNECRANYWGNPKLNECFKCQCNVYGSETTQCNRKTGACVCRQGIGGYNCDECDIGYLGMAPSCSPCGECFDNWIRILKEYRENTLREINRAKNIKKVGATGAYTKEFDEMQIKLMKIESLLNSTQYVDVDFIEKRFEEIKKQINNTEVGPILELGILLGNVKQSISLAEIQLLHLTEGQNKLVQKTKELEGNSTALQESDVQGALNLILNAKSKAELATQKADDSKKTVDYAERQCRATENLLNITEREFKETQKSNQHILEEILENLTNLHNVMPSLNKLICDGEDIPCDSLCGGAGCGSCGNSISCQKSAKQQADIALSFAKDTESLLKDKETKANDFIRNITQLNIASARHSSQDAYDKSYEAFLAFNISVDSISSMKIKVNEFLNQNNSTPDDITKLAREILEKRIDLKPEEITILANKIKDTVESLTNIEPIIAATADDLNLVQKLKKEADQAKLKANDILKIAEEVKTALSNSSVAQEYAAVAISTAKTDIDQVHALLDKIGNTSEDAHLRTNETSNQIENLGDQLKQLQTKITINNRLAQRVIEESKSINLEANNTYHKSEKLLHQYKDVKEQLATRLSNVENSKRRAEDLFKRAIQLMVKIKGAESKIDLLKNSPDALLHNLEAEILRLTDDMNEYNNKIAERESYYKKCT